MISHFPALCGHRPELRDSSAGEWDVASGAALVAHAGGTVTDIKGHPLRFNQRNVKLEGLIADNTILHAALMKVAPKP